jgi:hypothetical protein
MRHAGSLPAGSMRGTATTSIRCWRYCRDDFELSFAKSWIAGEPPCILKVNAVVRAFWAMVERRPELRLELAQAPACATTDVAKISDSAAAGGASAG